MTSSGMTISPEFCEVGGGACVVERLLVGLSQLPEHAAGHEAPGVELLCGPVPRPQAVLAGEEKGERLVTEPADLEIFETLCHQARELCEQSGLALAGAGERDEQGMILLVLSAPFLSCSC